MGRASLEGMLDVASKEVALRWHLQSNHFPPIPAVYDAALAAIDAAYDDDWDWDNMLVDLPEGVTWNGQKRAPAAVCVAAWHLEGFLPQKDYYGDVTDPYGEDREEPWQN